MDKSASAFWVAQDVMGMYVFGRKEALEALLPQVRHAAEAALKWFTTAQEDDVRRNNVEEHHFHSLMERVLKLPNSMPNVRETAALLARGAVTTGDDAADRLYQPLLGMLLANHGDVSWPIIGDAIVQQRDNRWRFEHFLSDRFGHKGSALEVVPENILFDWLRVSLKHATTMKSGTPAWASRAFQQRCCQAGLRAISGVRRGKR